MEIKGYKVVGTVDAAFGLSKANPQLGAGGLPQVFIPDATTLIQQGVLVPIETIQLN